MQLNILTANFKCIRFYQTRINLTKIYINTILIHGKLQISFTLICTGNVKVISYSFKLDRFLDRKSFNNLK